ncbi:uncharacterized protein LOC143032817 isoform X2 [Oratosquilla oratoria]|uniref:uncharacterized protein LOC143032817 isoform X2 n=1 Tax=Oratosquilla oratoria TaxID=337810 RepID=UPI003F776523
MENSEGGPSSTPMTHQGSYRNSDHSANIDLTQGDEAMELRPSVEEDASPSSSCSQGCLADQHHQHPPEGGGGGGGTTDMGTATHGLTGHQNGHASESVGEKNNSVYDFVSENDIPMVDTTSMTNTVQDSDRSENDIKQELEYDSSVMTEEDESVQGNDNYDDSFPNTENSFDDEIVPRKGRGRPRGSKNGMGIGRGRGRGRGMKFTKIGDDRTATTYDLRNIPDPFASQKRGRPRSRFIVDLGEQNHEAWAKAKDELSISDAELTTLLLSLLESRRECPSTADQDTMMDLIASEYTRWKEKFSNQISLLSHYSSVHNTNCCSCLGIKKKKYIPAGTGKRGRPRKYPPPVGYGPGMQRPETIDEDGNIFEPQIILKDGVKPEPNDEMKSHHHMNSEHGQVPANGTMENSQHVGPHGPLPPPLSKEEIMKRREYYNNHKNKIKYVCHYCQVHFYHKPNFDYHISKLEQTGKCRIFEKVNNLFLCDTCGEGFSWREKLEKHMRLAEQHGTHNQKELLMYGDFQCNMCGKTFNKRTTFMQHTKWHEEREDIPCVICGTMCKQTELRRHLMEVHSNDSLPCCYCGKLFTSRKYLEKHEIVHQGGHFPCPECGKSFSQKSNMQQHLKTHSTEKDYSCEHCGQTFTQRAGLSQHLKKHFGGGDTLECDVCGQYFPNEFNLKVHKKKIHNMHVDGLPDILPDHPEYLASPLPHHMTNDDLREKAYGAANNTVKNMLGVPLGPSVSINMKNEDVQDSMDDGGHVHMRDTSAHMDHMRHMAERRDTPGLMKDPLATDQEDPLRLADQHAMGGVEDQLHMPQDLTRMGAQTHMTDNSGRMSAAPQGHISDMRSPATDSPGRMTDTPAHMTDNLGRMAVENFGRMTSTPGGYLAEHLRRMAENQSRMSDSMTHLDERDNYSRLGDNLRTMSRGSDGMGRLGENLGRMADPMGRMSDNLSHMGVIRPTQTPSSTPQWPPHMQNPALDSMNQAPQASQHTLYPLPFWPYDPSLRQYHH